MGNHKFRLSDMLPNAWFYKLKDMGRTRNHNTTLPTKKKPPLSSSRPTKPKQPSLSQQRKSYYFTRDLSPPPPPPPPQPPLPDTTSYHNSPPDPKIFETHFQEPSRKSSNRRRSSTRRKRTSPRLVTSSVSAVCNCRTSLESVWTKPDSTPEDYPNSPVYSSSDIESLLPEFGSDNKTNSDIVIDIDNNSFNTKSDSINVIDVLELPPIITKKRATELVDKKSNEATKLGRSSFSSTTSKEVKTSPVRRFSSVTSPGVRLRTNSPRIVNRRIQGHGRKSVSNSRRSLSETFAVVKSSSDPQRDFRDSMVEVILENNLRASKDLEELLACYLSLNSDVYHDLIVKVFKQIWFDLSDTQLK
ncbi:transcription repressor OFP1-like [Cornus florida]|uniref:transcription repressor OFP1-like n=1 Tax=Cornus florida TaxID=4283 RepID=UPI00289EE394|nr:transcription repressor OFP1-like [Cornus florida]